MIWNINDMNDVVCVCVVCVCVCGVCVCVCVCCVCACVQREVGGC